MSQEVMAVANGPAMWIFAIITVAIVVVQAVMMYRLTKKYVSREQIMSPDEMKACIKTGAAATIGPGLSVFILALTMVSLMGAPVTLMRIGIVGSADTEMVAASLGTAVSGVVLGTDEMTMKAFAAALFSMAILSLGYMIIVPLIAHGLGKPLQRIMYPEDGQKVSKLTIFFGAIFPLLYFAFLAATQISAGLDRVAVMAVAAGLMFLLDKLAKDKDIKWLKEWSMGISILVALFTGPLFAKIF